MRKILTALAASAVVLGGASTATAAPVNPDGIGRQAAVVITNSSQVAPDALDGTDIKPLWVSDFSGPAWAQIIGVPYNTVGKPQLKADVAAKLELGTGSVVKTIAPAAITYLGGPYFDPARGFTTLGSFTLPKGTWLVNTSAKFHRTVAGVAGSRPQVGLRIGQGTASPNWGTEVGTVGGADISPGNGHDLFGSATKVVTVAEDTTVGVYGFGYNDDTGVAGSGEIEASAEITATLIG